MYNSLSLFPFCSLCIPNIAVYVIPNCWQLAEVGNTLLAVVKRWFVLYLSYMFFFFFPLRIYPKLSPSLSYLCFAWSCYLGCHACGCANHTLWLSLPVNFCSAMSKPKNKKTTNQPTSLQDLQLAYSSFWKACLSEINWIIAVGRSDCAWRWKLQRKVICGDDHSFNDLVSGAPSYFLPCVAVHALIHMCAFQQPHTSREFHSLTVWHDGKCGADGCLLQCQCCWKLVHPLRHLQNQNRRKDRVSRSSSSFSLQLHLPLWS